MKTPQEFLDTKCPLLKQVFADFSAVPKTTQTLVLNAMRDYALHVAAEQDKRTKDAVAAEVGEDCPYLPIEDLMNLQTQIKELK